MKNGVMPCRQHLSNYILVHFGVIAVLILTFHCRNNLRDVYVFMRFSICISRHGTRGASWKLEAESSKVKAGMLGSLEAGKRVTGGAS